jgi:peptidoglycan/xylan/chitin deacetylase (PgdA/CDA1 family)
MAPNWSWDFEEEKRRPRQEHRRPGGTPPEPPAASRSEREVQIRRRRVAALAIAGALLVIVIAVASGSSHGRGAGASRPTATVVHKTPPTDPELDGRSAVRSTLAYTPFLREGGTKGRDIALTFDDGPGPYTLELLKVLERYHVKATFFVVGRMLRYFSAATVRQIEDGDVIADHTENHPELAKLSAHEQYEELFEQIARIELLGGHRPTLFRPPYGSFNATTMRELARLHLLMVLWSVDTGDYLQPGVETIVQRAVEGAHPGAIMLLHDGGGTRAQTIAALPQIITKLRAKGYDLVTVPELLVDDPPPAGQQMPPNLSGD